jgi:hypothetical protein
MKWLINLFKVKEDEVHTGSSDFHNKIAEIQARIATVRSRNGWDQEPDKNIKARSKPLVAQEELKINTTKSTEMDDLKAKLLGKKK